MENRKFIVLAFCLLPYFLLAQETPTKINNAIYFLGMNKAIPLGSNNTYHIFYTQKRVVFIEWQNKANFAEYLIKFYDYYGNEITRSCILTGEMDFRFIEDKNRILAGQKAMLIRNNKSYLFDVDGNLINELIHDYEVRQIGITEDNNYVWFLSHKMRPLKEGEASSYSGFSYTPYNHVMIFDVMTGEFENEYSVDGATLDVMINNKNYAFKLIPPDLPG
jgi:hypothetical protein